MKLYTNTNRILSTVLATSLSLSLFASTSSATEAPTFTDVQDPSTWYYQYVMDAASPELGLVSGYTDGTFKPDQAMTVGEFLVMLTNTYPELKELSQSSAAGYYVRNDNGYEWYSKYVYAAHKSSLLPVGMSPTTEDMTNGITREEAAYMVYTAMTTLGGEYKTMQVQPFNTSNITDYSSIADGKREAVVEMYLKGIMSGYPSGDFGPQNELTRAELCVVMLKLNEPDRRQPYVAPSAGTSNADYPDAVFNENGQQVITEGTVSKRPQAVEGDIFIDKDGNEVVLVVGPSGVLGEGQGVAPDLGRLDAKGVEVENGGAHTGIGDETDAFGNYLTSKEYWVNELTGEGHWSGGEWGAVAQPPTTDGDFGWQVTADLNFYWSNSGYWVSVYSQDSDWAGYDAIRAANNL